MKNRTKRQLEIRNIVSKGDVHSQEELLNELKIKGFELTQATLSRDMKVMQVAKIPHPAKGYVYSLPFSQNLKTAITPASVNLLADGFKDLNFSGNLAVIHTLPGYASSIATVIDSSESWEVIGTIAGDDTILIIMRDGIDKLDLLNALENIMPGLKGKF